MKTSAVGFWFVALAVACGPRSTKDDGAGETDASSRPPDLGPVAPVSGTVWAPGNAPGMVPDGHEIPVAGAVVYVTPTAPSPIPDQVYCDPCQDLRPGAVVTDVHGNFTLPGVPAGPARLVIEKAQFRLERMLDVPEELGLALGPEDTTLPSRHDPDNGLWIPRMALAVGDSDQVEDIFGKMGILQTDGLGRVVEASFDDTERIDLYGNPVDAPFASRHLGSITDLFSDLGVLSRYHIVFVPCNFESDVSALARPEVRQNIRDYVAAGGKIYVTDWSAEWEDAAFPAFIQFDASMDTSPVMVDANLVSPADGDFGHFAEHASVSDPVLAEWLDGQRGPLVVPAGGEADDFPSIYEVGTVDAADFVIEGSWTLIRALPEVQTGVDEAGAPIMTRAKEWISGDYQGQRYPHAVTFEPSCGRVLYSTYHTAQKTHLGLVPQERVLLYLIMELGTCNDGPIVN